MSKAHIIILPVRQSVFQGIGVNMLTMLFYGWHGGGQIGILRGECMDADGNILYSDEFCNEVKPLCGELPEAEATTDKEEQELENTRDERIKEYGQVTVRNGNHRIHLLCIIGEIEGHDILSKNTKTTKYEHVLPQLAELEENAEVDGLLLLINTIGGAVESGLAIAEMVASLSKPSVSLVIGDSHSIGVPLAVATDYSYIVPSGTMIVHPVRMNGTVIGAPQTYEHFKLIQDRIVGFVSSHSDITAGYLEELMLRTGMLTNDLGTILVGQDAVEAGIINETGGIKEAMGKLHELIDNSRR